MCGISIQISKMSNELYAPFLNDREGKSIKAASAVRAISKLWIMLAYFFLHGRAIAKSKDPTIQIIRAGSVTYYRVLAGRYVRKVTIRTSKIK